MIAVPEFVRSWCTVHPFGRNGLIVWTGSCSAKTIGTVKLPSAMILDKRREISQASSLPTARIPACLRISESAKVQQCQLDERANDPTSREDLPTLWNQANHASDKDHVQSSILDVIIREFALSFLRHKPLQRIELVKTQSSMAIRSSRKQRRQIEW